MKDRLERESLMLALIDQRRTAGEEGCGQIIEAKIIDQHLGELEAACRKQDRSNLHIAEIPAASLAPAFVSAELQHMDVGGQFHRFEGTRNWLIAIGAVAVAELVVIGVLSAVVLGWGG